MYKETKTLRRLVLAQDGTAGKWFYRVVNGGREAPELPASLFVKQSGWSFPKSNSKKISKEEPLKAPTINDLVKKHQSSDKESWDLDRRSINLSNQP